MYLYWQGWNTFPVENQEGVVGSRMGEGGHWISLDRRQLHHLPQDISDDVEYTTFGNVLTKFLPETFRAEMIKCVVSSLSGRHRRSKCKPFVRLDLEVDG